VDGIARTGTQKPAWIQALRGVAAFMVVMVHSCSMWTGTAIGRAVAHQVLLPMAMGVDLFFIISRFLMVWATRDFDGSKAYAWQFLVKCFAMIWPLLAVMTPVALVVEHATADCSIARWCFRIWKDSPLCRTIPPHPASISAWPWAWPGRCASSGISIWCSGRRCCSGGGAT